MTLLERITVTLLWIVGGITFAVLYAPAIIVILLSFIGIKDRKLDWSDYSLKWYGKVASNSQLIEALTNSLMVGVCAVVIASAISLGLAYYMKTGARRGQSYVEFVIFLPFVLPAIITGISLLIAFRQIGIDRSLITVTAGHVVLILAVIYRMVSIRLDALENSQIEASRDLGANGWETFVYVVFPQLRSALVTSSLLAFALSFDETLVTFFSSVGNNASHAALGNDADRLHSRNQRARFGCALCDVSVRDPRGYVAAKEYRAEIMT